MIDKLSGKVVYADLSFGGFLGIGEQHHAVPWSMLNYNTDIEGYEVSLSKETLEQAPTFHPNDRPDWEDDAWGQKIHSFYNVTPYWL
jgi:hypothetical protein